LGGEGNKFQKRKRKMVEEGEMSNRHEKKNSLHGLKEGH